MLLYAFSPSGRQALGIIIRLQDRHLVATMAGTIRRGREVTAHHSIVIRPPITITGTGPMITPPIMVTRTTVTTEVKLTDTTMLDIPHTDPPKIMTVIIMNY